MMMGCPVVPLTRTGPFTGGVEVKGVKITVVVTLMIVKSKSPNLVARKDILMMWPMPLGSGPAVSPTTVIIMRTPTSCPW